MSRKQYAEEFKKETIKQILEEGYTVSSLAQRLGNPVHLPKKLEPGLNHISPVVPFLLMMIGWLLSIC